MLRPPPRPTLFPSPTLSRSPHAPPLRPTSLAPPKRYTAHKEGRIRPPMQGEDMPCRQQRQRRCPPLGQRRRRPVTHPQPRGDRKSTRLNSSHLVISYAVFCL